MRVEARIQQLIAELKSRGAIKSPGVERALSTVPRHQLVERYLLDGAWVDVDPADPDNIAHIYSDTALVTRTNTEGIPTSSASQPAIVAMMLEALRLEPGMRVLEIGTGPGYNAACIAEIVGDASLVTTIDIQDDIAKLARVRLAEAGYGSLDVRAADGVIGAPDRAPFDRIIVTVGAPDLSPSWIDQLAGEGELIVPLPVAGWYPHFRVWRDDGILGTPVAWSGFMPMLGELTRPALTGRAAIEDYDEDVTATEPFEVDSAQAHGLLWFAAMTDPRLLFMAPLRDGASAFGLVDDARHWAALTARGVVSLDAPHLSSELLRIHERWVQAGRPRPDSFELEFVANDDTGHADIEGAPIKRSNFTQYARLPLGPRATPGRERHLRQ